MSVLVCFAVEQEARPFRRRMGTTASVQVLVTGMGRHNTAAALEAALDSGQPALVLTCGFAGGLDPRLTSGTVLFDADPQAPLQNKLAAAGARPARFHCADRVAATAVEKRRLREATGADAVEMESAVVREICRQRSIPAATLRVILDAAAEDLPLDFNALMTPHRTISGRKLAFALLRAPGKIRDLLRLQKQSAAAAERLAEVLEKAVA